MTGWGQREQDAVEPILQLALQEDLGPVDERVSGTADLTSLATIPVDTVSAAKFVARQAGVIAGLPILPRLAKLIEPALKLEFLAQDGQACQAGTPLAKVWGPYRGLLSFERTALNFLQRLSGIASWTSRFVAAVAGTRATVLDTRKTTPGYRVLEKYAVRMGGGTNHRMGLYDGILIKDNHLAPWGSGPAAIRAAVAAAGPFAQQKGCFLEIEVDTLEQFEAALAERPQLILLDNMTLEQLRQAVIRRDAVAPPVKLEASGGVRLETISAIAQTGVDRISVGALTHSAVALDIGLDHEPWT